MAAPTSTNEVTARKFSSSISALWAKIKSTFQTLGNLVTAWGSTPSDTKYPSEKLVKDSLDGKQATLAFDGTYNASTNKAATVSTVTNAIGGLDVSSVGGNGKYISAISETDGKISATATTMDTTPTASSTKAVTSGGIKTALDGKIPFSYKIFDTNPFGGKRLYINYMSNAMYSMDKRYFVTATIHNKTDGSVEYPRVKPGAVETDDDYFEDGPIYSTCSAADVRKLFNGNYDNQNGINVPAGKYVKVHIQFSNEANWSPSSTTSSKKSYPYGSYYLSFYYTNIPISAQWRCYNKYQQHGIGWKSGSFGYYAGSANSTASVIMEGADNVNYVRSCIEFLVFAKDSINTNLTQIDWALVRPTLSMDFPFFTNFDTQKSYVNWEFKHDDGPNSAAVIKIDIDNETITTPNLVLGNALPVAYGGTGKTTAKAAEYNLTTGKSEISDATSGNDRVVFELASPSESNGVTRGFRKLSTIWTWIKGLLSSESGVNISGSSASCTGNAATATKATQDSDGNAINATYFKSSGNTTLVAGAATKIGTQNGTDVKLTLPTIPAAVRVKGDAESSYRTGDVNLTPANIGLTDAAIRGKISAGTDLSYDSSTGVMKVNTTGAATGNYAFVSGLATTASGNYSNAEGYKTTASSTSSHAEGSQTTASTPAAHAEGYKTTASGISAHAEGYRDDGDEFAGFSVASGFGSHVEGIDTKASDDASHAEGYLTESSGPHAHAEGESTVASGKDSHAEGLWSTASGLCSHAENSSFAYGENAHSEGYGKSSWGAVGVASHTEGSAAFAYGVSAHAEGGGTNALGKDSHAEGLGGGYRPIAITLTANHVAETSTFTGSTEGLSVGMYLLWKDDAHLTQQVSKITWVGNGTFGTQATFDSAIPAGTVVYAVDRGVAAGAASHVEGFGTSAVGTYAHAEGYLTKAIGEASHAEGQGTEARTGGMHAAGMYPATKEGFARVTGWGSAAAPKDIERLSTQGTLWVGGHFYGATPLKVVPGQTTYDEIYEAWSEQRPFVIEVSMLTHMAHAIYAPATIRAVPLDQAMDHWEFHFRVDYPYNYRAAFSAGGQEPYKVSVYYLAINEQQGWGKLVSGSNEWASLSDSRWYSVPVEYAALAETATEAQNAAASSPLANAINGKSDVGHKHPISDLTMGILPASLGGTGYNNLSDACSATLKAVTLGTDTTMYADDEIMGSNHTSGATDTSKFVRRKASTMKAYVLNGGAMTGQFTNSYQGYGYQASHGTSNKYVGFKAYREDTQVGVSLEVGSNGTVHGVYSSKLGTWIISEKNDSKIHIYNDRLIINSAGALRGSDGVVTIANAAENAGGVLSAGALRQTSFISKSDTFEVTNTDATVRGDGQLYFYRNTNATSAILAKWHVNSASTFATGYIQPGCTGVFQLTNNANNYFTRLS